jgi:hypothetical protein
MSGTNGHDRESLLMGFDRAAVERDPSVSFIISKDFELLYFNRAYFEFARQNGGEPALSRNFPVGSNLLDAISGELKDFHEVRLARALAARTASHHDYYCHTVDRYREFHETAYPLADSGGLLLVHSLKINEPMPSHADAREPTESTYREPTGLFTQCSNCRRIRRSDGSGVWDWVPAWVARAPEITSHSICAPCYEYYWKGA